MDQIFHPKKANFGGVFYLNKHGGSQSTIAKTVNLGKSIVHSIINRTGSSLHRKSPGALKKS